MDGKLMRIHAQPWLIDDDAEMPRLAKTGRAQSGPDGESAALHATGIALGDGVTAVRMTGVVPSPELLQYIRVRVTALSAGLAPPLRRLTVRLTHLFGHGPNGVQVTLDGHAADGHCYAEYVASDAYLAARGAFDLLVARRRAVAGLE